MTLGKSRFAEALNQHVQAKKEGHIMRYSESLFVLTFMFISISAQATLANCPACMGEQPDWTESATAFLEGKPIQDTPSTLSGPQQARLLNAQIDARKKASQDSDATVELKRNSTGILDFDLNSIRAVPNPANLGEEVKIIAFFGNTGSNLTTSDNLTVYADIKDSAGLDIGSVNLKQSSENEFSGIWNASMESDTYNVIIEASGPDRSKTFNDSLQIVVIGIPDKEITK